MIYRPPRTEHCIVCDNCVVGFDHHCLWLGTCVGGAHYIDFLLYVTCLLVALLILIVQLARYYTTLTTTE